MVQVTWLPPAPGRVGVFRNPPRFLKPRDTVQIEGQGGGGVREPGSMVGQRLKKFRERLGAD